MVAKPMVEYLFENGIGIVLASPVKTRADEMIGGNPLGSSLDWTMSETEVLEKLIDENDIIVSLLPYKFHVDVAKVCLHFGKSLVTTSYVQPDMYALDKDAKKAGIILLNEMGLDPGIDHMSAMRIIDNIHNNGGKVEAFYSICGALPAPEAADNPLRYKFTWSPNGVILASLNGAIYLNNGIPKKVEPADLFRELFTYIFPGVGDLEVYPNRDSVSYIDIYGIRETRTIFRGTFRFKGWCETLDAMKRLNMLDDTPKDYHNMSYAEFIAERGGSESKNIRKNIALKLGIAEDSLPMKSLEYLEFFSDKIIDQKLKSPYAITSERMISRLVLHDNERDMVALQHLFLASYPNGKREVIKSSLLDFGSPATNTAIARTVSLPAAIAARMILDGKIDAKGVHRPVLKEIYNPVLNELETLGIEMKEEFDLPESEMI